MEVITLGSRSTDEIGRVSPIVIPVDSLPIPGISILTNPLIIRDFGQTTEINSLWVRNADNAYIRPGINTDRVNIGGTAFSGSERLRVVGAVQADGYYLAPTVSITTTGGQMIFADAISSATLTELLSVATTLPAANVTVVDAGEFYVGNNVEDVLAEIHGLLDTTTHIHANKDLLDTYSNTDADITLAIAAIHDPVTLLTGSENGLVLTEQELSLSVADATTTGAISDTDWTYFNAKIDSTNTIDAIKDLVLTQGGIIVGVEEETAKVLPIGAPNQVLTVDSDGLDISWVDPTGGAGTGLFEVPDGYTSISNPIGGVNNTEYTPVTELDGVTILKVLQDMLFPAPTLPVFVHPTVTLGITPSAMSPATMFNGSFIESGGSCTLTLTSTLNSTNGPGGKKYALLDGSPVYSVNTYVFTSPFSPTFNYLGTATFLLNQDYKPNGEGEADPEFTTLANGNVVYADQYTGAGSGTAIATRTYTVVDPIYYGAFTTASTTYPTAPTSADITTGATKFVSSEPTSVTISITTYTGSVDTHKYICIAYPDSYGVLSSIKYVQGSNAEVLSSFSTDTFTYTRPGTGGTVTYRRYFALNSYTGVTGPLTYTVYF